MDLNGNVPSLSDSEFDIISKIIYKETRIIMGAHKKTLVTSRLGKRIKALNIDNFKGYIDYLSSDKGKEELVNFINSVTTNKTDFFRENKHFEYMKSTFLPNWENAYKEGKVKNLRIWSAACSSGEEPYSILITLHEYFGSRFNDYDIKVLASDVDTNVLAHGKEGVYREDVVSPIEEALLRKYFFRSKLLNNMEERKYKVKDILKNNLYFRPLNFKDEDYDIHSEFDLIFCRNVIIYFDKDFQKQLFHKLHSYMKKDSFIFIGHSETLFNLSDKFKYESSNIYMKI